MATHVTHRYSKWIQIGTVIGLIGMLSFGVSQGVMLIRNSLELTNAPVTIRARQDDMIQRMLNAGVIDEAKAREAIIHHAAQQGMNPSIGSRTEPADLRKVFGGNGETSRYAYLGTSIMMSGVTVIMGTLLLVGYMAAFQWSERLRKREPAESPAREPIRA